MATAEQNDRMTRVGPGTPMGVLMRRYWHPVAASVALSSGSRHASGNGASVMSISSTVATLVGFETGVRSTGLPASAFNPRWRGVMVSVKAISTPPF